MQIEVQTKVGDMKVFFFAGFFLLFFRNKKKIWENVLSGHSVGKENRDIPPLTSFSVTEARACRIASNA